MEEVMNKKEKKIVVAVDESEESMYALSWCFTNILMNTTSGSSCCSSQSSDSEESESEPPTLVLLYVKPPPPVYSALDITGVLFGSDVVGDIEEHSKELVDLVMVKSDAVCRSHNNINIKIEKKVGSGEAKDVICKCVEKLEADMLVMGSHDYGFLKRAFVGSVSEHCAKRAKCPVVVVKNPRFNASQQMMVV